MYAAYARWTDRGILADLLRLHGIADPPLKLLQTIARCVAEVLRREGLALGGELRSRVLLIGWFNRNYGVIGRLIPSIVIRDESRHSRGPMATRFNRYCDQNPDAPILRYLNGQPDDDADEARNASR
jgi:hypothetical protein